MKRSFGKLLLASLAALVLASFAMAPYADAAAARGGGGGGGGGARAAGGGGGPAAAGGGARQSAQVNNSRADARTNNVRSTSVNNVNVDRGTSTLMSKVMAVAVAAGTMTTIRSRLQRRLALASP